MELSVAMQIPDFDGRNIKLCKEGRHLGNPGTRAPTRACDFILAAALPTQVAPWAQTGAEPWAADEKI